MPESSQAASASSLIVKQSAGVGVVGAALMAMSASLDPGNQSVAQTIIPFLSGLIAGSVAWLWEVFRPDSAQSYRLRRKLSKKKKEISKQLVDSNISLDEKKRLQEQLSCINQEVERSLD